MPTVRLTDVSIRAFKAPPAGQRTYWDRGLGVRVSQGGSKTFVVLAGPGRRRALGRYPQLSLAEAKQKAKLYVANPTGISFSDALELFVKVHCKPKNRPITAKGTERLHLPPRNAGGDGEMGSVCAKRLYRRSSITRGLINNLLKWLNSLYRPALLAGTDVDLVVLSVAELGFKEGAKYSDIYARALECGLELCPAEVGPALRLAYNDQPRGKWLIIAMDAITVSGGGLLVFFVEHDRGELWLRGDRGHPDLFWDSDRRFVFVRRK